ncbi:MAG: pirin family protein [Prevotellaceae bacterium]|jgi:redox-sensitive bicupin YhaK (pirin superfamily)|nr:pirin family protein [Prevotellaceae bacterium]
MKTTLIKASTRGHANHGWLNTYHTFSFADYYDPMRVNFGALRVINDDTVTGGEGFGTHPHNNMEIVSIPLNGSLEHKDSTGGHGVIKPGDIQVMSAGTGVRHSEMNGHQEDPVSFFQIWVFTAKKDVEPRYQQASFDFFSEENKNKLIEIVGPGPRNNGLWIYQDAWFNTGIFDKGKSIDYKIKKKEHGLYAMVIEGEFTVAGQKLDRRDGIGVWDTDSVEITSNSTDGRILLIEVPMEV